MVSLYGPTNLVTLVNFCLTTLKGLALIDGAMDECILAFGKITKCTVSPYLPGLMEENTKETMMWIRKKVLEFSCGQMAVLTKVFGSAESSME